MRGERQRIVEGSGGEITGGRVESKQGEGRIRTRDEKERGRGRRKREGKRDDRRNREKRERRGEDMTMETYLSGAWVESE